MEEVIPMQNSEKPNLKKVIAVVIAVVILVILAILGINKVIKLWKYKSCNTKYISIKQYENLKIAKEKPKEVTSDAVDFALAQYLQNENLKQHDVQSTIKEGDTICINYAGRYNGSSFRNSDVKGLIVTLGNGTIDNNFEKQLIGHKPEEIFNVKMTMPDNYDDIFVAGKEVNFSVQVDYIVKSVEIPNVVTDDFIKKYTGYSTLAEYKQYIKKDLKKKAKREAEKTNREKAIKVLLKNTKVKQYPKEELKELENTLIEKDNSNALYSNVSEKEYRTNMGYKTEKDYKKHIAAIAKANNLEVPDDFTQKEQEKLASELGFSTVDDLNARMVRYEIKLTVKKFYVADFLLKHSK